MEIAATKCCDPRSPVSEDGDGRARARAMLTELLDRAEPKPEPEFRPIRFYRRREAHRVLMRRDSKVNVRAYC
jgi:hypothetical protein